ncbi:carboxypeptidase regulatory-like domain-containing protein [Methylocaldum szegediense]|uniref:Carboxypeptidase regulatory-like domain-containing protein n=1 Tax=Methylocaldum szegediense TaxID=73780 RepID=A0ABN8X793_9GAMM|nr:carboxypeptidase regulatory-like domain-containing protein [Methylocaldum szegediense]CAI8837735.1 putative Carboxypeptidase regulatory-like domain-containing protein [Methylocaldum szegediense]
MIKQGFKTWMAALLLACLAMRGVAQAAPEIQSGLAWLESRISSTGEVLDASSSIATPLQIQGEIVDTLTLLSRTPAAGLVDALGAEAGGTTEDLARQIRAYAQAGRNTTPFLTALLANQNADGGFGSFPDYRSNPLDTAFALIALKSVDYVGADVLSGALGYLSSAANPDGGYGLPGSSSASQVYVTAYALNAMQAFSQSYALTAPISAARQWLLARQSGGAYGETLSNAVAALALTAGTTDTTAFAGLIDAIKAAQQGDGSWGADPYVTALALRALHLVDHWTPPPTTGAVTGLVLEQGSYVPMAGAVIRLLRTPSAEGATGADGRFTLSGVTPGTYTVEVGLSGYATVSVANVAVSAGNTANLGNIILGVDATAAVLRGKITDGNTGAPLSGATVTLSGAATGSAVSDAEGSFQLGGLPAGAVTIDVGKLGYGSVTAAATLAANTVTLFSPSLYPEGTTPTTASLQGQVTDAATGEAIGGATVAAAGRTATTDASGKFSLTGLAAGSISASVNAAGYAGATLTGTLVNGVNDAGVIRLAKLGASATTVSGTVRDAATGEPIAGATVRVQDGAAAAVTGADGRYQLAGITSGSFTLNAGAAGYLSRSANVTANLGDHVVADFVLDRSQSASGIRIESVSTDQPAYDPYGEIEISAEVSNASDQPADLIFSATILDDSRNVVAEVPAIQLVLGQSPADAVQQVPANGNLSIDIDWYNRNVAPGFYSVVVRAVTIGGSVVAEGSTAFSINPMQRLGGGIRLNPPITQADSNQPIAIDANVVNHGNLPIPAGPAELTVTLVNPDDVPPPPPAASVKTLVSGAPLSSPRGGVFDEAGNYYVVNNADRRVIKVAATGHAELLATLPSTIDGVPISPVDLARDQAGALWILNSSKLVLKLGPDGSLSSRTTGLAAQYGIDLDTAGNFYITGSNGSDRVLAKLDPAGQTTILVANGLSGPSGIVAAGDGGWFVSNYNDNTVARIDASGRITTFAEGLNRPQGLTRDAQGNLYVANSGANTIVRIAPDGTQSIYATGLKSPADLRFDSAGNLFVSNPGDNTIAKVLPDGSVQTFARGIAVNPEGMRYDGAGNLYIANGNGTVSRLGVDGGYGVVATGLNAPKDIEIGADGEIYVAGYGNGRITRISGNSVSAWASGLQSPYGLAFDGDGILHVTESSANRISTLDGTGERTTVLESLINSPEDVLEGPDGRVYVLNRGFIAAIGADGQGGVVARGFSNATGFTPAPDGGFYVVDNSSTVKHVDSAGAVSTVKTGLPYNPGGIAADADGNVYVADYNGRQILKIDVSGTVSAFAPLGVYPTRLIVNGYGGFYALSSNGDIRAITPDGTAAYFVNVSGARHLALAADGRLFVATSQGVTAVSSTGLKTTLASGLSDVSGAVPLANGQWAVVERGLAQLTMYDAQGAQIDRMNGFSSPGDIVWTGGEFAFADGSGNLLSWVPGQHPRRAGSGRQAKYLAWRDGVLYLSDNSGVATLAANGSLPSYYTLAGLRNVSGLAFRADGALTLAGNSDSRVLTVNAAKQIVASYAGLSNPGALAVDDANNVFVASAGTQQIVKVDASGQRSDVFAVNSSMNGLAFDGSGQLYGVSGNAVYRFDAAGNKTTVASDPSANLSRLAFGGSSIVATSSSNGFAYRVDGNVLTPFAAGIAGAQGVRAGPDGAVYVAGTSNGTVTRYSDGGLSIHAIGLPSPRRLAFAPSGTLYVAGNSGSVMAVAGDGAKTDLKVEKTLGTSAFDGVAVDGQGRVMLTRSGRNDIHVFSEPVAPAIPPAGTVVHAAALNLAELPVDGDALAVALGSWTPRFSGDYEVRLRSTQEGVEGALVNVLHVGPHADARMSIDRTAVSPTEDTVGVSITVEGADFTSLAKVDKSNLALSVSSGAYPSAIGADAAGNIYFTSGGVVNKVDKAGTVTTFVARTTSIRGEIPVDSAQNLYIGDGYNSNKLLRIAPDGTTTLVATLPTAIVSLAIDSRDNLYALTANQIVKVRPDGSQSVVTSAGITNPYSLTIDGKGNLYVQNRGNVINRIGPDGSVSTLLTEAKFEYEGHNIAGDCADNLFLTPYEWAKVGQSGEEHILAQLIGRTGQVASILDGRTVNRDLEDMDFIVYDRFSGNLLIWTDYNNGRIYKLPVTCGAINTELHVVLPQGQSAAGLNPAPTGALALPDGATEYVWNLKDVTALGRTVRFDTVLNGLVLGEERFVARDAFLVFQNSFVAGDVRVPIEIPKVRVENLVHLGVATDKPVYPASADALISVDLWNDNLHPVSGQAVVEIHDALGVRVAGLLAESALIEANGRLRLTPVFNTGTTLAGEYTVQAALLDEQGAVLASGSAAFRIVAGDGSGATLSSSVSTDQAAYHAYDTVIINGRVRNLAANLILTDLTVGETVTNPSGQVVFTASKTIPQLIGGSLEDLPFTLRLTAAPPGVYTVTQQVTDLTGAVLDTRSTTFTVHSTAETGSGLTGTISVTPTQAQHGDPVTLSYAVGNLGNADVTGLPILVRLVDPATNTLIQTWQETVDLPQLGRHDGSHVHPGTGLTVEHTYAAVLSVLIDGDERVLAQATFRVIDLPVKLEVTMHAATGRVLALVSCGAEDDDDRDHKDRDDDHHHFDRGHDQHNKHGRHHHRDHDSYHHRDDHKKSKGDHDRHAPACLAHRKALLDRTLTELGIRHRIVTDPDAFRRAFRSGVYDTYWLSGGRVKLGDTLARELREAVYRGDGLLLDGQHDERNKVLDAAGGFLYRGKLGKLDQSVVFTEAPFEIQTLASRGRGLKLELAGGQAVAHFPAGSPAVVRHIYGAGRSLSLAFDLPAALADQVSYAAWRDVLGQALADLKPTATDTYTGGAYVQERMGVRNLAEEVTARFLFRLPAGAALIEPDPALTAEPDGGWLWSFDLPAAETRTLDLGLRLPDADGEYGFTGRLDVARNGVFRHYADYAWSYTVASAQTDAVLLRAALRDYRPPKRPDQQIRDRAIEALDQALDRAAAGRWDAAIEPLLDAGEFVAALPSPDAPAWRARLARLLQEYAWQAYRAETAPPEP